MQVYSTGLSVRDHTGELTAGVTDCDRLSRQKLIATWPTIGQTTSHKIYHLVQPLSLTMYRKRPTLVLAATWTANEVFKSKFSNFRNIVHVTDAIYHSLTHSQYSTIYFIATQLHTWLAGWILSGQVDPKPTRPQAKSSPHQIGLKPGRVVSYQFEYYKSWHVFNFRD